MTTIAANEVVKKVILLPRLSHTAPAIILANKVHMLSAEV